MPALHQRLVGVISGMIVWAVWFVAVYALTGVGCRAGWNHMALPVGINLLTLVMVITAVVALALTGWCGWTGYAAWRRARAGDVRSDARPAAGASLSGEVPRGSEAIQRQRFMGLAMALLSAIAAIGILLGVLPMLMLDPCSI